MKILHFLTKYVFFTKFMFFDGCEDDSICAAELHAQTLARVTNNLWDSSTDKGGISELTCVGIQLSTK